LAERPSCKRQVSGSIPLTGSLVRAPASDQMLEAEMAAAGSIAWRSGLSPMQDGNSWK
jgi:hypothetical protein